MATRRGAGRAADGHRPEKDKKSATLAPVPAASADEGGAASRKWPSVKAKKNLQINRLKAKSLFTVPNFLSAAEAKAFVDAAELIGFVHQGSGGAAKGEAFRDNDRISVLDPMLADAIWESGLREVFEDVKLPGKVAVGLNPNIRFYRYHAGQRFGRHIDESVEIADGKRTVYTLLVYLSGGNGDPASQALTGGETVFYDQKGIAVAEVAPLRGMALLHIHGAKCMLHEARLVKNGIKYVLRSDVVFASTA